MLGDKENLHYVVGLTGPEYSVILDLDDFNSIKDLTRLKLGLTIKGIRILRDNSGKFKDAINKFNVGRKSELAEIEALSSESDKKNFITYLNEIILILNKYNVDTQGFYEYMKLIIEAKKIETEKVWKKINEDGEKRYTRCLTFDYNDQTYIADSICKTLSIINKDNLDKELFTFNPEENEYPYYGG